MKRYRRLMMKMAGLVVVTAVRLWMRTIRCKVVFYDPTVDPVRADCAGQKIYVFWHENLLLPIYARGHCNLAMLTSLHRDADILTEAAYHLGFDLVRGSSFKGGSSAIRELMRKSRKMNLTITPDGPRGPRRVMAQGPIYLSSKFGLPLVLMGMGFDRPWRVNSWDRFAIPRLFSRGRAVISPAIVIPPNLDRDGIEHYRQLMEQLLNRLTLEAEAWAEAGTRKFGEQVVFKETAPLPARRSGSGADPQPVSSEPALPDQSRAA